MLTILLVNIFFSFFSLLKEECFIEKGISEQWYPEKDYHTMYVVEIEKILENEVDKK